MINPLTHGLQCPLYGLQNLLLKSDSKSNVFQRHHFSSFHKLGKKIKCSQKSWSNCKPSVFVEHLEGGRGREREMWGENFQQKILCSAIIEHYFEKSFAGSQSSKQFKPIYQHQKDDQRTFKFFVYDTTEQNVAFQIWNFSSYKVYVRTYLLIFFYLFNQMYMSTPLKQNDWAVYQSMKHLIKSIKQ